HGFARLLKNYDVSAVPRYIQKPAFMCDVFQKRATFGASQVPFSLARPGAIDYRSERFPGTLEGLEDVLVLPLNERYTEEHIAYVAQALSSAAKQLQAIAA
ncbi:MAG: hypothetical protein ACREP1_02950, partial [Rhodanobacteraceae bacterium]